MSRSKIKNYKVEEKDKITEIRTKGKQKVSLQRVLSKKHIDYIVKVKSEGKELKEKSMKLKFEDRFLLEIEKINTSLTKKNGIKKIDKVNRRIGRVLENILRCTNIIELMYKKKTAPQHK